MMRMSTISLVAVFFAVVFVFCVGGWNSVHAATLQLTSALSSLNVGEVATMQVIVNAGGVSINNTEAILQFPTDMLEVVSLNKNGSVFTLWVEEPTFSNTAGVIKLNGGIPTPGFSGSYGPVISIAVRAKKAGQATISFASAAVRANDGLGTDVLTSSQGTSIAISANVETVKPVINPVTPVAAQPSVRISSGTHVNEDAWSADRNPVFQWSVPSGSDAVQTSIGNNPSGLPQVIYAPAIEEKIVKDLDDGVWYFKVRARTAGIWGPVSGYTVKIDTAAPLKKKVVFSYDEMSKSLTIAADIQDTTSGVDYYEIYLDGTLTQTVPAAEFIDGRYTMPVDVFGDVDVKLVAFDHAGNKVEVDGSVHSSAVRPLQVQSAHATPDDAPLVLTVGSISTPALAVGFAALASFILVALAGYTLGRRYDSVTKRAPMRSVLMKGDTTKALQMLKKRLEKHLEVLQDTRHDRILTKEEKKIKEALENDLDEVDRTLEKKKG